MMVFGAEIYIDFMLIFLYNLTPYYNKYIKFNKYLPINPKNNYENFKNNPNTNSSFSFKFP